MAGIAALSALTRRLKAKGQDHVLKFCNAGKLSAAQTTALVDELSSLDLDYLESIFNASMRAHGGGDATADISSIEPVNDAEQLEQCSPQQQQHWRTRGLEAISKGEVCALVMSGGQGTRLGFPGPKGMCRIGLPSERTLFQIFVERVLSVEKLAKVQFPASQPVIPLYVMTSPMNHDETVAYFRGHGFFGLTEEQVFFFPQGTLPCFTMDGKLMLESAYKLATASNGNGGIYTALQASGALDRLRDGGVKYLHVFSVDNALCKVADPVFVGYCIDKQADCGNKVVWKSRPDERVGVVARKDGKFCVVEYSEMDSKTTQLVDAKTGKLQFGAANICNHFFTLEFLTDVVLPNLSLELHVAKKKIPMADANGSTITPTTESGVKLEAFIFDVFPLSSRMAVLSVPRENEFAPVKNAPGSPVDSPDTACQMLHNEATAWLLAAADKSGATTRTALVEKLEHVKQIEISPLVSYNGEALEEYVSELLSSEHAPLDGVLRLESEAVRATPASVPPSIRQRFEDAGQSQVFRFIDNGTVTANEASELVESLRQYDPAALGALFSRSTTADHADQQKGQKIEPLEDGVVHLLGDADPALKKQWTDLGLDAVASGKVAALVLGGGQGTRLGFPGPKGMYKIGLPSDSTLYEVFAHRVAKVQELARDRCGLDHTPQIPWLVMTSEMNHDVTRAFFKDKGYFGLASEQLHFFRQGSLPCFGEDGQFLLETPSKLARASNGNGDIYPALKRSGLLELLEARGVEYLHVFSVDNVLCKVADPTFVGYCVTNDADCANKVVWKDRANERVGVVAKKSGRYCIVEYSEMDEEAAALTDPVSGRLRFGAANICNHFYRFDFLKACCAQEDVAEYHVAHKKIPAVNADGDVVATAAVKLESFIFDVFPLSQSMMVLGVPREDEFAPVKNAPDAATDTPDTARHLLSEQCKRWLITAGGEFDSTTNGLCEIHPSISYNGEGLEEVARLLSPIKLPALINASTLAKLKN